MTDRTNALTVVLDREHRVDEIEAIIGAISMVKGVVEVVPEVTDPSAYAARSQVAFDLKKKLLDVLSQR